MRASVLLAICLLAAPVFAGCLSEEASSTKSVSVRAGARVQNGTFSADASFVATLPDGSLADPSLLVGVPALKGAQRFIGSRSFEPTIAITPKGSLFMVAFGGGAKIHASFDQGASWKEVTAKLPTGQNNPPNSNDPFVMSDPVTGRVFTSDLQALICSWLNYSDDEGKTWTTNPIGCGLPFGVHDHQSITTGKSRGTPSTYSGRLAYYCVNRVGDSSCAVSANGGLSFGPLIPVFLGVDVEAGGFCGGLHGHVKTDNAGRVLLPKGQCGVPSLGVSEDDGRTWKTYPISRTTGIRGHEVGIAADAKDNLHAFWIGTNALPYYSMSKDNGKTWSPARMVAPPGVTATSFPSIHASAEGKAAFAYIGTNVQKGYATTDWKGAIWHGYIGVITDALAESPLVLTTIVDSDLDPLARNDCTAGNNGRCNGMGDFIDIEIDPSGRPWAAFVDVCNADCVGSGNNDVNQGVAGTLASGPALTAEGGALAPLAEVSASAKSG